MGRRRQAQGAGAQQNWGGFAQAVNLCEKAADAVVLGLLDHPVHHPLGAGRTLVDLARDLAAKGHEVTVHAGYVDQRLRSARGVQFEPVRYSKSGGVMGLRSFYRSCKKLGLEQDVRVAFDAAMGEGIWRVSGGCYAYWVDLLRENDELRKLSGVRPGRRHRRFLRHEATLIGNEGNTVVAPSELVAEQLRARYPTMPRQPTVLVPGVDTRRFRPELRAEFMEEVRSAWGVAPEQTAILFVGGAWARRGLDRAIQALALLKKDHPDAVLVVVGEDPRRDRFEGLSTELGVRSMLRFVGAMEWVEHAYASADMLVLPTRYSPAASVPLEALASGLPVIVSDADGSSSRFEGLDCVRTLEGGQRPWHNAQALADAIVELMDPTTYSSRAVQARTWAESNDHAVQADAWEAMVTELREAGSAEVNGG